MPLPTVDQMRHQYLGLLRRLAGPKAPLDAQAQYLPTSLAIYDRDQAAHVLETTRKLLRETPRGR